MRASEVEAKIIDAISNTSSSHEPVEAVRQMLEIAYDEGYEDGYDDGDQHRSRNSSNPYEKGAGR